MCSQGRSDSNLAKCWLHAWWELSIWLLTLWQSVICLQILPGSPSGPQETWSCHFIVSLSSKYSYTAESFGEPLEGRDSKSRRWSSNPSLYVWGTGIFLLEAGKRFFWHIVTLRCVGLKLSWQPWAISKYALPAYSLFSSFFSYFLCFNFYFRKEEVWWEKFWDDFYQKLRICCIIKFWERDIHTSE